MISPKIRKLISLLGSFLLIILGIVLLQLKTPFETISAIEISGVLFILIGVTGIGEFSYSIIRRYWEEYSANSPTVKQHQQITTAGTNSGPTDDPLTICPVCNEKYPKSTIHSVCIMCGSPLDSAN